MDFIYWVSANLRIRCERAGIRVPGLHRLDRGRLGSAMASSLPVRG